MTRSRNLREDLRAQGVIVCDWAEALEKHGDLLQKYFGQAVPIDENRLTAEHAASINNGILVYVPKNVAVKEPITVAYLQDASKKRIRISQKSAYPALEELKKRNKSGENGAVLKRISFRNPSTEGSL